MSEIVSKNLDNQELLWTFLDGSKRTAVKLRTVFVGDKVAVSFKLG